MTYTFGNVLGEMEKLIRLQREHEEKTFAEIIENYDFLVGSIELKHKLMEVLPEAANITCSPYIESETTVYAIKRFDPMDLIVGESEGKQ